MAEPAGPRVFHHFPVQEPPPHTKGIVVASANLYHDFPRYRNLEVRLETLALLVEAQRVNILLLQEVARTPILNVDEWLRERLGMSFVYARANGHATGIGFEEGVANFS